jgi:glycerol-3-phosphate acyltransferase PlsX
MGGDHAPAAIVAGAQEALRDLPDLELILVGREDAVLAELGGDVPDRVHLVHANDVLEMHESPVEAIRRKADTSIAKAMDLLAGGDADALVSAGNTGGVVAAATFLLGRIPGARRAGIAAPFPTTTGHCVLMDVGANLQAKAGDLVEYSVMATEYARAVMDIAEPRVAVLSVGGEENKGSPLIRRAAEALRAAPEVRFTGNIEGQDIFAGDVDVVLCEGFVGNVILKASEGLLEAFIHHMLGSLHSEVNGVGDGSFDRALSEQLDDLQSKTDYTRYGGAPLMGHTGAVMICHGRSPAPAIRNAIAAAERYVAEGVNERIARGLATLGSNEEVAAILGGSA